MRAHIGQAPCPSRESTLPQLGTRLAHFLYNCIVNHRLKQVFADRISPEVQTAILNFSSKVINYILKNAHSLSKNDKFGL